MDLWNRREIIGLMQAAGRIAFKHYEAPHASLKGDESIVTLADREIEAYFTERLDRPEAGQYLLGEETIEGKSEAYLEAALKHTAWVVDPIDGTAPYSNHIPIWGISLGLMRGGRFVEGAIYLPVTREFLMSEGDRIYYTSDLGLTGEAVLAPFVPVRHPWSDSRLLALTQGVAKRGSVDLKNPVMANCCAVMPLAYLLLGRYQAYLGSLKLWDFGGGLPLLLKAGFTVKRLDGVSLGAEVSPRDYHLEAGHPRRWRTKTDLVFAADDESAAKVLGAVKR